MPWLKAEYDCGNCIIVKKYFSARWGSKGQVIYNKSNKHGNLNICQQRCNDRALQLKYDVLVNTNFGEGDIFITYTFARGKLPKDDTIQRSKSIWKYHRQKLRDYYRKCNVELKYIYAFQYEGVRPHFHILVNGSGVNVRDFPKWKYGTPKIEFLDNRPRHTIGAYFSRGSVIEIDGVEEHKRGKIGTSRNLIRIKPKIRRLKRHNWNLNPKAKVGYIVVKHTVENGYYINPNDNQPYQYQSYVMIKQERMIA